MTVMYLEPVPDSVCRCVSRTVGLVGGSRVRCRRRVDDCVSSEVGKLCDRSQQTTGIYKKTKTNKSKNKIGSNRYPTNLMSPNLTPTIPVSQVRHVALLQFI